MVLKLTEFIVTSKIIKGRRESERIVIFDKLGKLSVSIVMLLPGVFVFRCIIIDYKIIMNIVVYFVTIMLAVSFISRIRNARRLYNNDRN
jgi:multisubunit Na+/H+ antiporter MnhF subunit